MGRCVAAQRLPLYVNAPAPTWLARLGAGQWLRSGGLGGKALGSRGRHFGGFGGGEKCGDMSHSQTRPPCGTAIWDCREKGYIVGGGGGAR